MLDHLMSKIKRILLNLVGTALSCSSETKEGARTPGEAFHRTSHVQTASHAQRLRNSTMLTSVRVRRCSLATYRVANSKLSNVDAN
jgi:hypothetical protein